MLNSKIDSIDTTFYAVFDDLTYKEICTLNISSQLRPIPFFIIEKKNIGKTKSLYNSEFFAHSTYLFYDLGLTNYNVEIGGWSLIKVKESQDRSREVSYPISDPNGEIRTISNLDLNRSNWSEYFQIIGICKIVALIRKLSQFPDWTYYDLMRENEFLKQEVALLKKENEHLKTLI